MSFEGRYQFLCGNGHLFSTDCYNWYPEDEDCGVEKICPTCKSRAVWYTLVDETNGPGIYDDDGNLVDGSRYPGEVELEVFESAVACQCSSCGNHHIAKPTRYRIPENVGHKIGTCGTCG